MAIAPTAVNPRRKPATYGKTARRSFQHCQSPIITNDGVGMVEDSYLRKKAISDRVREDSVAHTSNVYGMSRRSAIGPHKLSLQGSHRATRESESAVTELTKLEPSIHDLLYDVPSSDDESEVFLDFPNGKQRKRRRTDTPPLEDSRVAVWDDASLQRHIAAEVATVLPLSFHRRARQVPQNKTVELSMNMRETTSKSSSPIKSRPEIPSSQSDTAHDGTRPSSLETGEISKPLPTRPAPLISGDVKRFERPKKPSPQPNSPVQKKVGHMNSQIAAVRSNNPETGLGNTVSDRHHHKQRITSPRTSLQFSLLHHTARADQPATISVSPIRVKIKDRLHSLDYRLVLSSNDCQAERDEEKDKDDDQSSESSLESLLLDASINVISSARPSLQQNLRSGEKISINGSQSLLHRNLPPTPHNGAGPKLTYARQRSYLTQDDLSNTVISDVPVSEARTTHPKLRQATSNLSSTRQNNMEAISKADDEDESMNSGSIKSIHELREAGGNKRVVLELEAILDDLDESGNLPISIKRGALLSIATRLQQPDFCRRFIDFGLESRLLGNAKTHVSDTIANVLFMAAILPVLAQTPSPRTLTQAYDPGIIHFLEDQLDSTDDFTAIIRNRKFNVSKVFQQDIANFCKSFLVSCIWRDRLPSRLTGRIVSMQCLEYIVRHMREAGNTSNVLSQVAVKQLSSILPTTLDTPSFKLSQDSMMECQLALSLLESSSISCTSMLEGRKTGWARESTDRVAQFLTVVQGLQGPPFEALRTLALRLCLNLTNNNSMLCETFSKPDTIKTSLLLIESSFRYLSTKPPEEPAAPLLDNLVLSLGLLINLAEWSETTREIFVNSKGNGQSPPLDTLTRIFQANVTKTAEVGANPRFVLSFCLPF